MQILYHLHVVRRGIMARIDKRQSEKEALEAQLAVEAKKERILSAEQVSHFLTALKKGGVNDDFRGCPKFCVKSRCGCKTEQSFILGAAAETVAPLPT